MIFLFVSIAFTLYLFFHFRSVLPGVRGTFFSAAILIAFFVGFYLREYFFGTLVEAVFTVWFCEAALLFLGWDAFRLIRGAVVRKPLAERFRLMGNRAVFASGILLTAVFFLVGVPTNADYRIRELVAIGSSRGMRTITRV